MTYMTTTRTPEITTAAFVRATGKAPRGFGRWGFQPCSTRSAFADTIDETVEPLFVTANYGEAKAVAARYFASTTEFVAVLS